MENGFETTTKQKILLSVSVLSGNIYYRMVLFEIYLLQSVKNKAWSSTSYKRSVSMSQKLFISYSRQQTPFIDRLAVELEKAGHTLWLDYRSLVPAKPWYDQIKAGIIEAEAFLLVVSKGSISSPNVEPEWRLALEQKERVILLIFDAAPLPPELKNCEWVDFRANFKKSMSELTQKLGAEPAAPATPVPQSGFKVPKRFWLALALTVVLIFTSLPAWWTILVPLLLIPLPWQIFKRNYMYSRIGPLLTIIPVVLFSVWVVYADPGDVLNFIAVFIEKWGWIATIVSWSLLGLLMSPGMQLRMRPEAARVRFANPLVPDKQKPRSVSFAIDHAAEDGRYAVHMTRRLQKYGHRLAGKDETPEAVFVLISAYKKSTQYDPEQQNVFPVLLQAAGDIDEKLQRIQWLDFRKGTKNIDKVALLLPQPERMLKALAVAPTGAQEIMPIGVNVLQYYFLLFGILGIGALLIDIPAFYLLYIAGQLPPDYMTADRFIFAAFNGGFFLLLAVNTVRVLRSRSGGAAIYPLFVTTVFLGFLLLSNSSLAVTIDGIAKSGTMLGAGLIVYPIITILLGLFLLFRWREVYNWFPRRQDESRLNLAERFLLLYTPRRGWLLVLHILFHSIIFYIYMWIFVLSGFSESAGLSVENRAESLKSFLDFLIYLVPILLGTFFLARFFDKKKISK